MLVLALDISTHAGYALLETWNEVSQPTKLALPAKMDGLPRLLEFGNVAPDEPLQEAIVRWGYPRAYVEVARDMATKFWDLAKKHRPDVIVVEETNLGKSRYAQKMLEFLHCMFNERWQDSWCIGSRQYGIVYISSSAWRHALGLTMSKEDKKNNARLSKAKRRALEFGTKLDKKSLGVKGKVTTKHLSVRYVNERYAVDFQMKDNDIADAVCLGLAHFQNAETCDGKTER